MSQFCPLFTEGGIDTALHGDKSYEIPGEMSFGICIVAYEVRGFLSPSPEREVTGDILAPEVNRR